MTWKGGGFAQTMVLSLILLSNVVHSSPLRSGTQTPTSSQESSSAGTGTILTQLETEGNPNSPPFATTTSTATTSSFETPINTFPTTSIQTAKSSEAHRPAAADAVDAFLPVATGPPPAQITTRLDHPLMRLNIAPQENPLHTNKFYANLFLGFQSQSVWTHPYSVSWSKGGGVTGSWGLAISHIEANQRAFGNPNTNISGSPASFVINPIGIQSLTLSAAELGNDTILTTDTLEEFSVNSNLLPLAGSLSSIKFPLVQGMGVVTGVYTDLQPNIESGVFYRTLVIATSPATGIFKYQITTEDNNSWLLYAVPTNGVDPEFTLISNALIQGPKGFSGVIQIAKNSGGTEGEAIIDASAGVYAISGAISGSVSGTTGSYTLSWTTGGASDRKLLMYALAHHQSSFDFTTKAGVTSLKLATTTKGDATAVVGNSWTMVEPLLPGSMGFAPWTPSDGTKTNYSSAARLAIAAAGAAEVAQDMGAQSNLDSFYYAGKALSKFASIVWALENIANLPDQAALGLARLKVAFELFTTNQNQYPLVYDGSWKGVVSSAWNDSGADFGNSYYNDHHFHFGYFIHAAAMLGAMDSSWLANNKDYINTMVRDVSNPSKKDTYFPVFRSFDFYHGHSWAKGLFESGDSKDEESSSEDVMFAYGLKMWGNTIGDASMEARGNLMLAILARSLQSYFLMESDNIVQPIEYIGNKVTGILFENKMDHTTYFGGNFEYVQGIHMIPLTSASVYTRTKKFVQEEWDVYFAEGAAAPASTVTGGWKSLLYANLALIDPVASFNYFNDTNFDPGTLDNGASRTWYLAFAAGLGGA